MPGDFDSRLATYEHIQTVQKIMSHLIGDLLRRQQVHDHSKLNSPEVEVFDEYTPKLAASTYGSDEYKAFLSGMKPALDHHYAKNSHHPEHYCWRCGVCNLQFNDSVRENSPQGPNDSGMRYCPKCCSHGIIYEASLTRDVADGILGMNILDILEMLCDWKAASMRHKNGDIRRSIEMNQTRFGYSNGLKQIMLNSVPLLDLAVSPKGVQETTKESSNSEA